MDAIMDAKQISEAVMALHRAKKRGARLTGNSIFERALQNWHNQPEIICPMTNPGIHGDIPEPYEKTMGI